MARDLPILLPSRSGALSRPNARMPTDEMRYLPAIVAFLEAIGLRIEWGDVPPDSFLPGVLVIGGGLRIDAGRLSHPGDLLHEAGHLAGLSGEERGRALPAIDTDGGAEMMAIAWSHAAALHIGVPLEVLFHAEGYKGGAESLIENFAAGRFIGVPMLQYFGLAFEPRLAAERGLPAYPHMHRWLRP
jgi:hypothetical protein